MQARDKIRTGIMLRRVNLVRIWLRQDLVADLTALAIAVEQQAMLHQAVLTGSVQGMKGASQRSGETTPGW